EGTSDSRSSALVESEKHRPEIERDVRERVPVPLATGRLERLDPYPIEVSRRDRREQPRHVGFGGARVPLDSQPARLLVDDGDLGAAHGQAMTEGAEHRGRKWGDLCVFGSGIRRVHEAARVLYGPCSGFELLGADPEVGSGASVAAEAVAHAPHERETAG